MNIRAYREGDEKAVKEFNIRLKSLGATHQFPEKYISGDDANGTRKWLNQALSEFSNNNFKKGISLISIMPDSDIEIEAKPLFTGNKS